MKFSGRAYTCLNSAVTTRMRFLNPLYSHLYRMKVLNLYLVHLAVTISSSELGGMERSVTKFGTGAKVDCPKWYSGKKVYLVITEA